MRLCWYSDCKICRGLSKTKCMFCGAKRPQKKDLTDMEKIQLDGIIEELKWLQGLYAKLKNMNMATTGHFETDEKIRTEIGDWGELSRGSVEQVEEDHTYTVRLDTSESLVRVKAPYLNACVGQRVTVRFIGGIAVL